MTTSCEMHYSSFTTWCEDHCLSLNVKKTKELVIDFRIKKNPLSPLVIKDQEIEQVQTYKYVGVIIDDKKSTGKCTPQLFVRN